jgi:hypothetical protein
MQPPTTAFHLRQAHADDLPAINGVIERAIATWQLPERVKRLSLPSYRYHMHDLVHLHLVVAEDDDHVLVGVAAWEPANPRDLPAGKNGLLLHGLYVDPSHQHRPPWNRVWMACWSRRRPMPRDFSKRAACSGCPSRTRRVTIRTVSGWPFIIDDYDRTLRLFPFFNCAWMPFNEYKTAEVEAGSET